MTVVYMSKNKHIIMNLKQLAHLSILYKQYRQNMKNKCIERCKCY